MLSHSASKAEKQVAEDLADALATKLTISSSKGKQKAAPEVISEDDLWISAMQSVNSVSQELFNVVRYGWKKSLSNFSKTTLSNAESSALTAEENLCVLHRICLQGIDVERAAVSVLGKLVKCPMPPPLSCRQSPTFCIW